MRKLLFILFATFAITSCTTVDTNEVGIKYYKWSADENLKGGVVGTARGFTFFNPFTQRISKYPTSVQDLTYDPFVVNANGGSAFLVVPMITYYIDSEKAIDIFVKYRKSLKDLEKGYIKNCILEAFKIVANRYSPDELTTKQESYYADVKDRLNNTMGIEGFMIDQIAPDITPPETLRRSIEAKEEAVQKSIQLQNEIEQTRATAEKEIVAAEGKAKALKIEADAEAYYNERVSRSLTPILVQQYAIEKWNGIVPVISGGSGTYVDASKFVK